MKTLITFFVAALILFQPIVVTAEPTLPPWREELPEGREQATIIVGETPVVVDLALTPPQHSLGLGYRNGLEPGTGMLFVFDKAERRNFWMRGMRFCLDIVWIQDGVITGAAESVCPDPPGTSDDKRPLRNSDVPVQYVLEVPAGWLEEHGYGPGTPVDLSEIED